MAEKTQLRNSATAADQLREEYERQSALFDAQPTIVQRFLEAQASQIANALYRTAAQPALLLAGSGNPFQYERTASCPSLRPRTAGWKIWRPCLPA